MEIDVRHEEQMLSWRSKFWILSKFFLPIIVSHVAPGISEQALSRGITSIAADEMTDTLASFGLAFNIVQILVYFCAELRDIGLVLVHNRQDNVRMTLLSLTVGIFVSLFLLAISLSPAAAWLIRDVHKQNGTVVSLSRQAFIYLTGIPFIEAIVAVTVILIYAAPQTQPILIPVLSWYGGVISRMVVVLAVWRSSGRKKLLKDISKERAAVAVKKALIFWSPLTFLRLTQKVSRVVVNLVVSRTVSENVGPEAAAMAIAVLAAIFPFSRILHTWVFDIKQVIAAFGRRLSLYTTEKFTLKELALYSAFINLCSLLLTAVLVLTPGVSYFLLNTVLGLIKELSTLSLIPLQIIFAFVKCLTAGFRSFGNGILILKRKTVYLTPSGVFRLIALLVALYSLPLTSSASGAVFGMTSSVIAFATEGIFVAAEALFAVYKPDISCRSQCEHPEQRNEADSKLGDAPKCQVQTITGAKNVVGHQMESADSQVGQS